MRCPTRTTLAVACLVVLAGCSLPFGDPRSPTTTATATPTPTPEKPDPYPPGVSADGVENGTALYRAHVDGITVTGYEAVATVNTTIRRGGVLMAIESTAQIMVEPNASRYHDQRRAVGGPVDRREEFWSNGSVEFYRLVEFGAAEHEQREPRTPRQIAGRRLLLPFLEGGNFTVESIDESGETARITLVATSMADHEAVRRGLPDAAESIRSFEARVVVADGRIRSMVADVGFEIDGTNRTHRVEYQIVSTGSIVVEQPDWVEEARERTETASADPGRVTGLTRSSRRR